MSSEEKVSINPEEVGSLEELLGPNDSLFQPEPSSELLDKETKQNENET